MIKSWMVIGAVTFLVALGSGLLKPRDIQWFKRLRRPRWLVFEPLIPLIWTVVFICGAWSAYIVWEKEPGTLKTWLLMGSYLLVEILIVAYSPVMLWLHSLRAGRGFLYNPSKRGNREIRELKLELTFGQYYQC